MESTTNQASYCSTHSFGEFLRDYGKDTIAEWVESKLQLMYDRSQPKLADVCKAYGDNADKWIASIVNKIFDYADLSDRLSAQTLIDIRNTVKLEFGWLKATELMHFAHLMMAGRYESFYNRPNGYAFTKSLWLYIRGEREEYRKNARAVDEEQRKKEAEERQAAEAKAFREKVEAYTCLSFIQFLTSYGKYAMRRKKDGSFYYWDSQKNMPIELEIDSVIREMGHCTCPEHVEACYNVRRTDRFGNPGFLKDGDLTSLPSKQQNSDNTINIQNFI